MRHLLLSSLLLLSGCSLIRVSGLPVAAAKTQAQTKTAAVTQTPTVINVPTEGFVRRVERSDFTKCDDGLYVFATIAELELAAPVTDWTLKTTADGRAKAFVSNGACPAKGQPEERVSLPAGRHRIAIVWRDGSEHARSTQTLAFFPGEKPDPMLHAEIPEKLPVDARYLADYYPFLETNAQALEVAPKQMFVFAKPGSYATPVFHGVTASQWADKQPIDSVTMLDNEPLLLTRGGTTYVATDLTEVLHAKVNESPAGAIVIPETARGAWLGFETLMEEADASQKVEVDAFRKKWTETKNCLSGAIGRFNASTVNVIITPKQREAASVKLDKERKLCREKEADAARDALKSKLLEQRRANEQKTADALRPRVRSMF